MKKQTGRSMIEMLGVLAVIAVLSIGGLLGYRRAVNNHHANTILDDANRLAFVMIESNQAFGNNEYITNSLEFTQNSPYNAEAFLGAAAGQFGIIVESVPRGVCESLLPKAATEYKIRVMPPKEPFYEVLEISNIGTIYDTLNTDICNDENDIVLYFGDASAQCNKPDDSGYTPCTENSDCCGGEFCAFQNPGECEKGDGICLPVDAFGLESKVVTVNGVQSEWFRTTWKYNSKYITWWSAVNLCQALGKQLATRADLGCGHVSSGKTCTTSTSPGGTEKDTAYNGSALRLLQISPAPQWNYGGSWLNDISSNLCGAHVMYMDLSLFGGTLRAGSGYALCH